MHVGSMVDFPIFVRMTRLFLAVLMIAAAGCSMLSKSQAPQFLAPLNSQAPAESLPPTVQSEQELCRTTAKTVASKGHTQEAIKLYERSEHLDESKPANMELAPLYAQVGDFDASVKRYRTAIAEGDADPELWNNLAWTLMEKGDLAEAMRATEQGLLQSPTHKRLLATSALLQYKSGDSAQAFEMFSQLYGAEAAHHNLAILELEHGRVEQARHHATLATQSGNSPSVALGLAQALEMQVSAK